MMKQSIIFCALLFLYTPMLYAASVKSDRITPKWLKETPVPSNNSFDYYVQTSIAPALNSAREGCFSSLVSASGHSKGFVVKLNEESSLSRELGTDFNTQNEQYDKQMDITAGEYKMYVRELAEYYIQEKGMYKVSKLYQVSSGADNPLFDSVVVSSDYGLAPLAYSLIPGIGQFVKGDTLKGSLFLSGVSLSLVGFTLCQTTSLDFHQRATMSHNASYIRDCNASSASYATASYAFLGIGCALYIYNLIDAALAGGASRIVVSGNTIGIRF